MATKEIDSKSSLRNEGRILCLPSALDVGVFDLGNMEKIGDSGAEHGPQMIDYFEFFSRGYPDLMSCFEFESKLYFLGGAWRKGGLGYASKRDSRLNSDVFVLNIVDDVDNPGRKVLSFLKSDWIPPMNSFKIQPIVEIIDGKIYVLQIPEALRGKCWPVASFEVFDPSSRSWTTLSAPPFCPPPGQLDASLDDALRYTNVTGHLHVGHKFIVVGGYSWVFSYDIKENKWDTASADALYDAYDDRIPLQWTAVPCLLSDGHSHVFLSFHNIFPVRC
ncbi:hypothetical protein Ancab_033059 [Ancistrocladus abbreviatus]